MDKTQTPWKVAPATQSVADQKKVRFGAGYAPKVLVKAVDGKTEDPRKVRFGAGYTPRVLGKA